MEHYYATDAHIDLPGMNVLVKRAADNRLDAKGIIPLRLDPMEGHIGVTEGGTWRSRLGRRLFPGSVSNRLNCEGYDAIVTLPLGVRRCTWTRTTLVHHEAYELALTLMRNTDPLVNLPGWPTLLLCHDSTERIVQVHCRSEVTTVTYRANHSRVLHIGKGTPLSRGQRRLRRMNLKPQPAKAGLIDGYAAVVRVPRGTTVRVYKDTPLENGTPEGAIELIVE